MEFFTSLNQLGGLGLLALRAGVAMIFFVHGRMKKGMWKMQPSDQMKPGMLNLMRLLSIAEPLGAIAVLAGFLTQLAALGLSIVMVGAIVAKIKLWKKAFSGDSGWEFEFMVLMATIALLFLGAGSFALDRSIFGI